MSYENDIFPAFSSVAKRFHRTVIPDTAEKSYVAGLWLPFLAQDLLWNGNRFFGFNVPRPATWRAPTWSWASQRHFIWFRDYDTVELPETSFIQHFDANEIVCTPADEDLMGELKTAYALFTASLVPATLHYEVRQTLNESWQRSMGPPKNNIWIQLDGKHENLASHFKDSSISVDYALYEDGPGYIASGSQVSLMELATKGPVASDHEQKELLIQHFWLLLYQKDSSIMTDRKGATFERIGIVEGQQEFTVGTIIRRMNLGSESSVKTFQLE